MAEWANPYENSKCKTVGCIAGHLAMDDLPKKVVRRAIEEDRKEPMYGWALEKLVSKWREENIPEEFSANFSDLFVPSVWPERFDSSNTESIVKWIDYFLKTGK